MGAAADDKAMAAAYIFSSAATLSSVHCQTSFWGNSLTQANSSSSSGTAPRVIGISVRAEGFDLWQVLGGRGLQGGEDGLDKAQKTFLEDAKAAVTQKQKKSKGSVAGNITATEKLPGSFDKEFGGLTGGFPGGEKGLQQFIQSNPLPPKPLQLSKEIEKLRQELAGPGVKPRAPTPPLLMPGMTVIVNSPLNPYHMYSGIVQRVTDGRAGVLFEGGNWDKLVTFRLPELERTTKGPPMSNPKSAVLDQNPST